MNRKIPLGFVVKCSGTDVSQCIWRIFFANGIALRILLYNPTQHKIVYTHIRQIILQLLGDKKSSIRSLLIEYIHEIRMAISKPICDVFYL